MHQHATTRSYDPFRPVSPSIDSTFDYLRAPCGSMLTDEDAESLTDLRSYRQSMVLERCGHHQLTRCDAADWRWPKSAFSNAHAFESQTTNAIVISPSHTSWAHHAGTVVVAGVKGAAPALVLCFILLEDSISRFECVQPRHFICSSTASQHHDKHALSSDLSALLVVAVLNRRAKEREATMGAAVSEQAPEPPYRGRIYQPERTYDITCTDEQRLAGVYNIRENGKLQYRTNFTRAKHRVNVTTVHLVSDDGQAANILAACRGGGPFFPGFCVKLDNPFVPRKTVVKNGKEVPQAYGETFWQDIKTSESSRFPEPNTFKVGSRKFQCDADVRTSSTTARFFIGNANRAWAHWVLLDLTDTDLRRRVAAAYIHTLDDDNAGNLRVAQLKLYYHLDPTAEAMALAVIVGLEMRRGPLLWSSRR
ncbi:hypothetical protein CERZMDRAFT_85494 [Cercospora zeae-maydis SCOH1-5]|uniref:Uncharacterized protein n=1 Tax=Cercospora zeae-maydis SCOH1-5 TaxID=717836 RepID=A0A6A6FD00_9PEZI|nr:hypothetical protein CERZMDRAFT_85494 [Cercospora zeae-maydis SCOH1-5]